MKTPLPLLTSVVLASLGTLTQPLNADIVTVEFSGEVGIILGGAPVEAVFTTGDTFTGSFTYDSDEPDGSLIATLGQYGLGMQEFTISFLPSGGGSAYYTGTQSSGFQKNSLEVNNGVSFDSLIAAGNALPNPPGLIAQRLQLNFKDTDASTFADDSLPNPPPLDDLDDRNGSWTLGVLRTIALTNISASVASAGTDYATWIMGFGLPTGDYGFELDPDRDKIVSGLEGFFGTNPNAPSTGLAFVSTDGTTTVVTHPQLDPPLADVTGSYQWSLDGETWYAGDGVDGPAGGPTVTIPTVTPTGGVATVTATASEPLGGLYLRVVATR